MADCIKVYNFVVGWLNGIILPIETDRQTDILLTEIKVITDLFVIVIREIYVHVYTRMLVC